jgi:predicted permease
MDTLVHIATDVIAPILMIVAISIILDRILHPDPRGLSQLVVYLFTPFLVLEGVANSNLEGKETGQLIGLAVLLSVVISLIAWGVARSMKYDQRLTSAFILTVVVMNSGNYGIPVCQLAFGAAGETRALIFFVGSMLVIYTWGVFLASRGSVSTRQALMKVVLNPMPYALIIGFALNLTHHPVADMAPALRKPIEWLSDAAIPAMMVVLGLQLSRAQLRGRIQPILVASGLRLVLSPLIAVVLAALLGMSGVVEQVSITQAGMPTAVIAGVLATEYKGESDFVIGTILVGTVVSLVTLTVLLALVM